MQGRSSIEALHRSSHIAAHSHTLCDAAVFGIVIAGIRNLQAVNRCLNRRNLCSKARFANRLSMSKACDLYVDDVFLSEGWIDPLQTSKGVVAKSVVGPGKLCICHGHVIRNVYDSVAANTS